MSTTTYPNSSAIQPGSHPETNDSSSAHGRSDVSGFFGTVLLYLGIGLLIVAGLDRSGRLPFSLPDLYYNNRPYWPFFGIVATVLGFLQLRREPQMAWAPDVPGQRFDAVVVYTRRGCHLCDEAVHLLQRYSKYLPGTIEVDIDEDPELQERFTNCVPVVEFDGKIRFRGRVNEQLLRRLIEGTKPVSGPARQVHAMPGGT